MGFFDGRVQRGEEERRGGKDKFEVLDSNDQNDGVVIYRNRGDCVWNRFLREERGFYFGYIILNVCQIFKEKCERGSLILRLMFERQVWVVVFSIQLIFKIMRLNIIILGMIKDERKGLRIEFQNYILMLILILICSVLGVY